MNDATGYNFAYLDEQTKRMLRRAILKAIAIPGYQVPFASREMPMPRGWGTGGMQVTAAVIGPDDILKVIDQGADDTTNAVSIRKFFEKTAGVRNDHAHDGGHPHPDPPPHTRDGAHGAADHRLPGARSPSPCAFSSRARPRRASCTRSRSTALMHVKLYEDIARHGISPRPMPIRSRSTAATSWIPSPTPKFDNPKMHMCPALQLFGAGREKRIYAMPPYTPW